MKTQQKHTSLCVTDKNIDYLNVKHFVKTKVIANDQGIDQNSHKVDVYTVYLYNEKQQQQKNKQTTTTTTKQKHYALVWSLRLHGARAGDSLEMIETKSLNMTVSTVIPVHINQFDR